MILAWIASTSSISTPVPAIHCQGSKPLIQETLSTNSFSPGSWKPYDTKPPPSFATCTNSRT